MTNSGPAPSVVEKADVIALHGFLGLPADWNPLGIEDENLNLHAVDLWTDVGDDFAHWALRFNAEVRSSRMKPVLMGYSMGGRLAMQALLQAPELYRGAVFISAHPGLQNENERAARREVDRAWAARFREEEWGSLMGAWMSQSVLQTPLTAEIRIERHESDFDRERLAAALVNWSLANQPDFRPLLEELDLPLLFVTGSDDAKFTALLNTQRLKSHQRFEVIAGAGHRVPWDQPAAFRTLLRESLAGFK